jgi:hypothetical protein
MKSNNLYNPIHAQRVDPGRIVDSLFNCLWAHASAIAIVEAGCTGLLNQVDGNFFNASGNPTIGINPVLGPTVVCDGTGDYWGITHRSVDYSAAFTMATLCNPTNSGVAVGATQTASTGNQIYITGAIAYLHIIAAGVVAGVSLPGGYSEPYLIITSGRSGFSHVFVRNLRTQAIGYNVYAGAGYLDSRTASYFGADATGGNAFIGAFCAGYTGNIFLTLEDMIEWSEKPFGLFTMQETPQPFKAGAAAAPSTGSRMFHVFH